MKMSDMIDFNEGLRFSKFKEMEKIIKALFTRIQSVGEKKNEELFRFVKEIQSADSLTNSCLM